MAQRKWWVVFVAVALLSGAMAMAQEPAGPPQAGPEHKRLNIFAGKWSGTADMQPGPWGPGGKMTYTETCEWFEGGFALVCHSDGMSSMGAVKGLAIMTYKPEEKTYLYMAINSVGDAEISKGTVRGKTWNWAGESKAGGKTYQTRFTLLEVSDDASNFKMVSSSDGISWPIIMEGTATRVK